MTDTTSGPSEPNMEPIKKRKVKLSVVWLFPLIAIAIGLAMVWQNYNSRGPLIQISFRSAEGLKAGDTALKYRSVVVGKLEDLRFSADLGSVIGDFRIDKDVAKYVDADATFWVVKPEISAAGISGLDTVLSGSYIEGEWDAEPGAKSHSFTALDQVPLTRLDQKGTRVTLKSRDGAALTVGAPVFFRDVEVGRVESKRLTSDGAAVDFDIFVDAPHDARLTKDSRFWIFSGIDFSFGADGAHFSVGSLGALMKGGVSFQDFSSGAKRPVEAGEVFPLYNNVRDARAQVVEALPGEELKLDVYFGRSVRGLATGAPVEYEGIRVGRVLAIGGEVDVNSGTFSTRTTIAISPSLIGVEERDIEGLRQFIAKAVENGLRAQLNQGSLLTGQLIVRLIVDPTAPKAKLTQGASGNDLMPSIASNLDELTGSIQGVLQRVEKLPIESIFDNISNLLENVNKVIGSEGVRQAPEKLNEALSAFASLMTSPGVKAVPKEVSELLAKLNALAGSKEVETAKEDLAATLSNMRAIVSSLEQSGISEEIAGAVAAARARLDDPALAALAGKAGEATDAVTALLTDPSLKAAPARALATIDALETLLTSPGVVTAPAEAEALLVSLRKIVEGPEIKQAITDFSGVLASARAVVDQIHEENLAQEISDAIKSAEKRLADPELGRLTKTMADATAAAATFLSNQGLKETPDALNNALKSVTALLDDPATKQAPKELTASLTSARAMLDELREKNVAGEIASAVAAARNLMDDPSLRTLSDEAAKTATALRQILDAPGAQQLPEAATEALQSTARLFDRISESDLAGNAAAALQSFDNATSAVSNALKGAPQLVNNLTALAARADAVLASFDVGSELNYEAVAAIREIRDAARAISDLADLVERQPNALIIGK